MKLLIDDADIKKIRKIYEFYAIDGVTTNPSILAKTGRNPYEILKEIRDLLGENAEVKYTEEPTYIYENQLGYSIFVRCRVEAKTTGGE